MRHGGDLLIETLVNLGAKTSFGVPGESFLAALDGMHDRDHRFVLCRQEGGAAFMAAAWGKLTGEPGICFVTRGPGATNASIGVHTAMQDSVPMLLFVGQIGTDQRGREAFQEVDYRAVFGTLAKWAVEIDHVERIPEVVGRAWTLAQSGRPGPVVIALPEDMLSAPTDVPALERAPLPMEAAPSKAALEAARAVLSRAKRPLILMAGANWSDTGRAGVKAFAEGSDIPVICGFRYQDQFDNFSACYAGEAGVAMPENVKRVIREADAILALNVRFGEMMTDAWRLLEVPAPAQKIVHVHADAAEIGKIYQPDVGVHASHNVFAAAMTPVDGDWADWRAEARAAFEAGFELGELPSPVDMGQVTAHLRDVLPEDAILTNGAGNFAVWPNKFYRFGPKARLLAPQSGAMGYGVPAAIAACVAEPARRVVCFAGDGDFQMNGQELATARQAGAAPIILIVNNGIYGTIRAHQETHYPGRVSGTTMVSPDFAALARAYGMYGERVERTEGFAAAFDRACASETGAVLDLHVSAEALTPRKTLSEIRGALSGLGQRDVCGQSLTED